MSKNDDRAILRRIEKLSMKYNRFKLSFENGSISYFVNVMW